MKLLKILFIFTPILCSLQSCTNDSVTVTLDPDGGSIRFSQILVKRGTKYKLSSFDEPTKDNYDFYKWTFSDGEEIPDNYYFRKDVTLKANYVAKDVEKEYIKSLNVTPFEGTEYFYEITYSDYDYKAGNEYLDENWPALENGYYTGGNCSSVYSNHFFGRNFDWKHGTVPEFVIHTKATNERHATLGIALGLNLSNENVGTVNDVYHHRMLPFITTDGVNDAGLCIAINEVDKRDTYGVNSGSNPGKDRLNALMLVRYVLDYASTVQEAEALLKERDVYTSNYLNEQHFMIADASGDCAEIEFKPTSTKTNCQKDIVFIRDDESKGEYFKNIATNFTFINYKGDCATTGASLTNHACGTERYNLLYKKLYDEGFSINSMTNMQSLMSEVYYTKTYSQELTDYSSTFWYSEYHYGNLTKNTPKTKNNYKGDYEWFKTRYNNRIRTNDGNAYYNTTHSSAYDLKNRQMLVVFEEEHLIPIVFSI